MDLGIKGKRALVTGAGRGIGRSIAINLAAEGATLAVVSRTASDLESLVEEIGGAAEGHIAIPMDLMEEGAPDTLLDQLEADFGLPEIVVHNLGGTLDIRDAFCSIQDWRKIWRLNVEIGVELNLRILPAMQAKGWGRVVHVSSIAAVENQGPIPYCSTKAALNAYVRSMGRLVSPDGVIVNAVLPGPVFTEDGDWDRMRQNRPEHVEKFLSERVAIQRFGVPDEIGRVVAFLASEHASFCVGSIVPVDGGQGRGFFSL